MKWTMRYGGLGDLSVILKRMPPHIACLPDSARATALSQVYQSVYFSLPTWHWPIVRLKWICPLLSRRYGEQVIANPAYRNRMMIKGKEYEIPLFEKRYGNIQNSFVDLRDLAWKLPRKFKLLEPVYFCTGCGRTFREKVVTSLPYAMRGRRLPQCYGMAWFEDLYDKILLADFCSADCVVNLIRRRHREWQQIRKLRTQLTEMRKWLKNHPAV